MEIMGSSDFSRGKQNCLAKALYDNIAEAPDELAFRRGDVLVVLEQNTAGIEGWWLCSLRGRQGICPGNRLRLMPGLYADSSDIISRESVSTPSSQTNLMNISPINDYSNISLQQHGKRRSWHVQPNKVLTPKKINDVYLYDLPVASLASNYRERRYDVPLNCTTPSRNVTPLLNVSQDSVYDVPSPLRAVPIDYDTPRGRSSPLRSAATPTPLSDATSYDIPRSLQPAQQLTPSSSASSLTSLSSSNRSSLATMPDYDVPKSSPRQVLPNSMSSSTLSQANSVYDVPTSIAHPKELPIEINSALDNLESMQKEVTAAIGRLLGFVTPQWRSHSKLEPKVMDIKLAVVRLRTSLHDLAEFGEGTLGNAARAPDKGLAPKLRPLVKALRDADNLIQKTVGILDCHNWSLETLARKQDHEDNCVKSPDALDQLIACARALTEDVRQTASFIQGNSTLLFKKSQIVQSNDETDKDNNDSWPEDYDYVNLDSKEAVAKQNAELRDCLPQALKKGYDVLIENVEQAALVDGNSMGLKTPTSSRSIGDNLNGLNDNDKRVLSFYTAQAITHSSHLTQAIDAFLQTVEHNQPPKVFLAYSKFVVLSAHCLVHIGDTVYRNVVKQDIRSHVLNCANALSEALAATVAKTKQAALQFPSVTAVQEMVDSIVDVSHAARDLKLALVQAVQ